MINKITKVFGDPGNTLTVWSIAGITIYSIRLVNRNLTGYLFGKIAVFKKETIVIKRDAIPLAFSASA